MKILKVRFHKIQLAAWSITHCTVVNHKLIWIIMQQPFCTSCWWRKQGRQLYFQAFNFLGDFFNLVWTSSSYSSCVKWNLLHETFLHNSIFFVDWDSPFSKHSSKFTVQAPSCMDFIWSVIKMCCCNGIPQQLHVTSQETGDLCDKQRGSNPVSGLGI